MTLPRLEPGTSNDPRKSKISQSPGPPIGSRAGLQLVWKAGCGAPLHPQIPVPLMSGCHLSPALEVAGACGQEHVVGVPVQAEDSGANGLLDVLAHPPGYGSQTGREKREADPLTSLSGASVPQELRAPTVPCRPVQSRREGIWALLADGPVRARFRPVMRGNSIPCLL